MPQFDELFKEHAKPLSKLLVDKFPNGIHPSYENVHQTEPSQQIEDHERNTLKEVVNFYFEEGFVRQSKVDSACIVLTEAGLQRLGYSLKFKRDVQAINLNL
ncbi:MULTISPECIES: hypothetical protein [unclassified Pseudoalteromonas]|uniref:hypothetical protein n=2 Tax=Pseudoalteromonas TaxID=53246 RepID=UPI001F4165D9|nr:MULTISPECIES: hypothetical protein [unclassified Pseudoalteromonas]MCF2827101.1 hypothetical protein [Pseudoalteromonas sp. OF5H-5]MCF2925886.1 hypothetical protein [Pseudoalteromonas sp. DL2-H1]